MLLSVMAPGGNLIDQPAKLVCDEMDQSADLWYCPRKRHRRNDGTNNRLKVQRYSSGCRTDYKVLGSKVVSLPRIGIHTALPSHPQARHASKNGQSP